MIFFSSLQRAAYPLMFSALAGLLIFSNCNDNRVNMPSDIDASGFGSAMVNIKVGKVGVLSKQADITMKVLDIRIIKKGADSTSVIEEQINLSGKNASTIQKVYDNLPSPQDYILFANTRDVNDSIIHSSFTPFTTTPSDTVDVALDLNALYSMLRVSFNTIPAIVNKVTLGVVNIDTLDSLFSTGSRNSVVLSYDYLPASIIGKMHKISMRASGTIYGTDAILYAADTSILAKSGIDTTYKVLLKWVGPSVAPNSQATITIDVGIRGTTLINAEFDNELTSNLVAYYPFNGNVKDESGNGNNGTISGAALFASDRKGNANSAVEFDGIDDFIHIYDSKSLRITGQITMSAWFKAGEALPFAGILCKVDPDEPRRGYLITINDAKKVRSDVIYDHSINEMGNVLSDTVLLDNTWHHVAAVYDSVHFKLYIDGVLNDDVVYTNGLQANTEPLLIGWDRNTYLSHRHFKGSIDDIRIFSRALNEIEISKLFNE